MSRIRLAESVPLSEAATGTPTPRRFRARLIEGDIWGSSGYYSRQVLEAAAEDKVFAAGTMIFLDHPGVTEAMDRPERSVRDLAGRLASDAVYESDGLYADIEVYPHVAPLIEAMAEDIGMSIRATAEVEYGEAAGRRGQLISQMHEALSVDFVTQAGAGGKIVSLAESARTQVREARSIGQWVESRIHRDFTILADDMAGDGRLSREERIILSSAIGEALAAFVTKVEADAPQLYQRDLWDNPQDTVAAAIEAAETSRSNPAGRTTTTEESEEDTMPQIEEARLRELEEASGRVPTLEAERDAAARERDEARRELAETRAREAARDRARNRVREANADLPAATVDRIIAEATRTVPLTESGELDTATFDSAVDEARTAEETYLAGLAEAAGAGSVSGFGSTRSTHSDDVSESDVDAALAGAFGTTVKGA